MSGSAFPSTPPGVAFSSDKEAGIASGTDSKNDLDPVTIDGPVPVEAEEPNSDTVPVLPFGSSPFGGETPFFLEAERGDGHFDDSDTEGVPTGLPVLLDGGRAPTPAPVERAASPSALGDGGFTPPQLGELGETDLPSAEVPFEGPPDWSDEIPAEAEPSDESVAAPVAQPVIEPPVEVDSSSIEPAPMRVSEALATARRATEAAEERRAAAERMGVALGIAGFLMGLAAGAGAMFLAF